NKIKPQKKCIDLVNQFQLKGRIVFGYAGNIGSAQGIKIITDAAKKLKSNNKVHFVIIGDGVEKEIVKQEIIKNTLNNVTLLPPVSKDSIIKYLSLFDVSIIPLVKNQLFRKTIPSKL